MPETFYHVDSRNALTADRTIELETADTAGAEANSLLEQLYPGGLSSHGRHYCTLDLYDDEGTDLWDVATELVFEAVRFARFPGHPSRFQSVFGFRALRDARRFVEEYLGSSYPIWRVTADRHFVADMRLVDAEDYASGVRRAHYYWGGETFLTDSLWEVLMVPPVEVVDLVEEG